MRHVVLALSVVVGTSTSYAQPSPAPAASSSSLAIVPFTGLHADEPQSVVVRMLKKRAQLVAASDVGATNAQVIISGAVERAPGHLQLVVSALSVKSGDVLGQLSFAVPKTRHLTREQLHELATRVNDLANQALTKVTGEAAATGEAPSEEEANAAVEAAVAQANDTEQVPMDITSLSEAAAVHARPQHRGPLPPRPRWAPLVDANLGVVISGRSVSFDPGFPSKYKAGSGGGIHADVTLYPLAYTHDRWKGVFSGLGGGVTLDAPFWPTTQAQADNPGAPGSYHTNELRVEGGARWKFTLKKTIPRLELTALLGAGMHKFFIARFRDPSTGGLVDVGPPNVTYVFGAFGLMGRVHFREYGSVWAAFSYEYVPDAGHVEDVNEYGYSSTWGLHLRGGIDIYLWRGLKAGVSAYWERFALDFQHTAPISQKTASGSVDNYYGGVISVGYTL